MPWTLKETSFELAPQCSLPKQYMCFPSVFALKVKSPLETDFSYVSYCPLGFEIYIASRLASDSSLGGLARAMATMGPYPEVNIEVSSTPKLPIANLEGHRHLVIFAQGLVEAFAAVGGQANVVGAGGLEQSCASEEQPPGGGEEHGGGLPSGPQSP